MVFIRALYISFNRLRMEKPSPLSGTPARLSTFSERRSRNGAAIIPLKMNI
jgi:hypothetical protein